MKKRELFNRVLIPGFSNKKLLLMLNWTITLTFLLVLKVSANSYSQNVKVDLDLHNAKFKKAFTILEQKGNIRLLYSEENLPLDKFITLSVKDTPVLDVLRMVLNDTNLQFKLLDNGLVVISPQNNVIKDIVVRGQVIDSKGETLPGVSVKLKGTTIGVTTDLDGRFTINAADNNSILVFTYIGYVTQEVAINNQTTLNVKLEATNTSLDEIVVVGYGTQRKENLTGAIATISADKLKNKVAVSYAEAMVGQMAGVQIQQTNGAPGNEGLSIRVRGTGSITAGMAPLYVIDGYPMEGSAFSMVNASDIESIQVLKDASSTAIYGSRGSNGVIMVTTKKGKLGTPTIAYNTYFGLQQVAKKIDMMNSQEYLEYFIDGHNQAWLDRAPMAGDPVHTISDPTSMRQKYSNSSFYIIPDNFYDPSNFVDIDWQDQIFRNAMMQRHEVSVMGGAEKTRYSVSGGFTDQDGIQIKSDHKRYNIRSSLTSNINKKLEVGLNVSAYYSDNNNLDNGKDSPLSYAVYLPPIYPINNADGTYGSQVRNQEIWAGDVANPLGIAENVVNYMNKNGIIASTYAEYSIIEGLKYKLSLNGTMDNQRLKFFRPSFVDTDGSRAPKTADARNETFLDKDWVVEQTLNYNKTFSEKHVLGVLGGYTVQKSFGEYARVNAQNFPNDVVQTINAGQIVGGSNTEYMNSLISYLGRINYSFDNKYLLTANIRTDGSSKFGSNSKWGTFPSLSIGWRIDQENFMKDIEQVNDLKVRASWGLVGNNRIGNYDAIARTSSSYYSLNGSLVNAVNPNSMPNPDLGWETTQQWNLGFDLGLLNDRIHLEGDFYNSRSVDLLLNVPVPTLTGYTSQLQNIGQIENKGMEFLLKTRNFVNNFKWSTDFNISFNKNKVLALGPDKRPIYAGAPNAANTFITTIGMPVATFYGYKYDGVFKNQAELNASPHLANDFPGDPRYVDMNKDGKINADDKTYLGNNQPKYIYGMNNDFSFKSFDLNVQLTGSYGAKLFSFFNRMVGIYHGDRNGLDKLNNRWRSEEDPGDGTILRANRDPKGLQKEPSSYWVEDGSYLRIRNVSLGYTFDNKLVQNLKMKSLRAYVTGQNLHTFTKYIGYDPETSSQGSGLSRGGDYLGYPSARIFIAGLNVSF